MCFSGMYYDIVFMGSAEGSSLLDRINHKVMNYGLHSANTLTLVVQQCRMCLKAERHIELGG